jgi:hypothetical protein
MEQFALKAEEMTKELQKGWSISIKSVGESLGLSNEDSVQLATYLRDAGWATCNFMADPTLTLTPEGYRAIRKLRNWPRWLLWVDRNPGLMAGIAVLVGLTSLAVALLK